MLGVWQSPVAFQQTCSLILNGLCSLKLEATDEGERYWEGPLCPLLLILTFHIFCYLLPFLVAFLITALLSKSRLPDAMT